MILVQNVKQQSMIPAVMIEEDEIIFHSAWPSMFSARKRHSLITVSPIPENQGGLSSLQGKQVVQNGCGHSALASLLHLFLSSFVSIVH